MFEFESKPVEKEDDVYHFIAFVPHKGLLIILCLITITII